MQVMIDVMIPVLSKHDQGMMYVNCKLDQGMIQEW